MAPNNEVSNNTPAFNVFEELQKSLENLHKEIEDHSSMIKFPTEDNVEETDDKVTVTLKLGDFKADKIKVSIQEANHLYIEGNVNADQEHGFVRSLQLPFPCLENDIKTQADNDDSLIIVAIKDHEKVAQLEKEMKEKEEQIKEAIEKFNAMANLKPIVLEAVEEDDKYYSLKINLGDYVKDELSIQFHGPHHLTIEAAKDGQVRRRFLRPIYFELPCNVDQDVLVLEDSDNLVIAKIAKDMKAIKEIEEFNKQMKPIQDFFNYQTANGLETEDNANEIQMKLQLSKDVKADEVKVNIDEDNLVIEVNHEEQGTKFSLYKSLPMPEAMMIKD